MGWDSGSAVTNITLVPCPGAGQWMPTIRIGREWRICVDSFNHAYVADQPHHGILNHRSTGTGITVEISQANWP